MQVAPKANRNRFASCVAVRRCHSTVQLEGLMNCRAGRFPAVRGTQQVSRQSFPLSLRVEWSEYNSTGLPAHRGGCEDGKVGVWETV